MDFIRTLLDVAKAIVALASLISQARQLLQQIRALFTVAAPAAA